MGGTNKARHYTMNVMTFGSTKEQRNPEAAAPVVKKTYDLLAYTGCSRE